MAIINDNNRNEIIKNYRFKISDKLMKVINKILGYTINSEYYDKQKQNNMYYIDFEEMNELFKNVCERYNFFAEFNKPLGVTEEEYEYFLNHHNMYMNLLNRYFNNGKCSFSIKKLFYKNDLSFEDVEKIILIFSEIYDNKEKMYTFREYKDVKNDIIDSLSYIITDKELNEIKNEYSRLLSSPNNLDELKNFIDRINQMVKQDYIKKISNLDNIDQENFSFVVHSIKTYEWKGKFYDPLISASLINNDVMGLYSLGVGFILDPSSIVSANSSDTYTSNNFTSGEFSTVGMQPIIYSYDKVISDCRKRKKENPDSKVYNEIVLTEFKPLAIFYYPDENDFNKRIAINLKEQVEEFYPNLRIVEIGSKVKIIDDLEDDYKFHI